MQVFRLLRRIIIKVALVSWRHRHIFNDKQNEHISINSNSSGQKLVAFLLQNSPSTLPSNFTKTEQLFLKVVARQSIKGLNITLNAQSKILFTDAEEQGPFTIAIPLLSKNDVSL